MKTGRAEKGPAAEGGVLNKSEQARLDQLQRHVDSLVVLVERARVRAYGTGKRNAQGFVDRGCGKKCCVLKYEREQKRLDQAREKLVAARQELAERSLQATAVLSASVNVFEESYN